MTDTAALRRKPVLSVAEAAALLGWDERRARREARRWLDTDGREGVIPCRRSGRHIRIKTADLLEMLGGITA